MSVEMTHNSGYTPAGEASVGGAGANDGPKLPPRNNPNLYQNVYERCESYTGVDADTMDFVAQSPPPLYEPCSSYKSDENCGFYAEIALIDDEQIHDEYDASATNAKFQLLPEGEKKGKEDTPKEMDAPGNL